MKNKQRTGKTTREQYEYYVDFLESNKALRTNKNTPKNPKQVDEAYEKLATGLNSLGGPERNGRAWKKIFADWRSRVKKKARTIAAHRVETGGGPEIKSKLTDLEEKLLGTIGRIVIDGAPGVIETGILPGNVEVAPAEVIEGIDIEIIDVNQDFSTIVNTTSSEPIPNRKRLTESHNCAQSNSKKYKTGVELVTEAYKSGQENNREVFSAMVEGLKGIKESLGELAKAQMLSAEVKFAELKVKYPNIDIGLE